MAKKKSSDLSNRVLNALLIAFGIYLVILGIFTDDMSQSWSTFCVALGLALQTTGTIGFAKLK